MPVATGGVATEPPSEPPRPPPPSEEALAALTARLDGAREAVLDRRAGEMVGLVLASPETEPGDVVVIGVRDGGLAAASGAFHVGDVVLAVDGHPVTSHREACQRMLGAGETIRVHVEVRCGPDAAEIAAAPRRPPAPLPPRSRRPSAPSSVGSPDTPHSPAPTWPASRPQQTAPTVRVTRSRACSRARPLFRRRRRCTTRARSPSRGWRRRRRRWRRRRTPRRISSASATNTPRPLRVRRRRRRRRRR